MPLGYPRRRLKAQHGTRRTCTRHNHFPITTAIRLGGACQCHSGQGRPSSCRNQRKSRSTQAHITVERRMLLPGQVDGTAPPENAQIPVIGRNQSTSSAMRCHVVMTPSWQPTSIGGSTLACKFWASAIDRPLFLRAASSERPHRSCMRAPIFSTQATTTRRLGLVSLACVRLITVHVSESRSADDCRAC